MITASFWLLVGLFIGWVTTSWFSAAAFDSGWATLVGSAAGAAITVLGSVLVARQQSRSASNQFENLVIETIRSTKNEAQKLCDLTDRNNIPEPDYEEYAESLQTQVNVLQERIKLFRGLSPFSQSNNYNFRISIFKLEDAVADAAVIFEKEIKWLGTPTAAVLRNSQGDLFFAASKIFEVSYNFLSEMGRDPGPGEDVLHSRFVLDDDPIID